MANLPIYQKTRSLMESRMGEIKRYYHALSRSQDQIEDDSDIVDEAVRLKRMGRYDESCKIYLDLMHEHKMASSEILYYLFKSVACAGCFDLSLIILFDSFEILIEHGYAQGSNQENWLMNMGFLAARIVNDSDLATVEQGLTPISGNPNYKIPVDIGTLRNQVSNLIASADTDSDLKSFLNEMIRSA